MNKFNAGSYHGPHYDFIPTRQSMLASIHVFLTDSSDDEDMVGGEFVFPLVDKPIRIIPKKGMAIVYHNTNEDGEVDFFSAHGELPLESGTKWTARKWIYTEPVSKARRLALPILALPFGGKAPAFLKDVHNILVEKFGPDVGSTYFDQLMVLVPMFVVFALASLLGKLVGAGGLKDGTSSLSKTKKNAQSKKSKKD